MQIKQLAKRATSSTKVYAGSKNGGGNAGSNKHNDGSDAFNKNQMKVMNKMFKAHFSTKKDDSNQESKTSADDWKKGINLVRQIFIAQQYGQDNSMHLDKEVNNNEDNQLKELQKKAKNAEKAPKRS